LRFTFPIFLQFQEVGHSCFGNTVIPDLYFIQFIDANDFKIRFKKTVIKLNLCDIVQFWVLVEAVKKLELAA
jgi:hypothetical protein